MQEIPAKAGTYLLYCDNQTTPRGVKANPAVRLFEVASNFGKGKSHSIVVSKIRYIPAIQIKLQVQNRRTPVGIHRQQPYNLTKLHSPVKAGAG